MTTNEAGSRAASAPAIGPKRAATSEQLFPGEPWQAQLAAGGAWDGSHAAFRHNRCDSKQRQMLVSAEYATPRQPFHHCSSSAALSSTPLGLGASAASVCIVEESAGANSSASSLFAAAVGTTSSAAASAPSGWHSSSTASSCCAIVRGLFVAGGLLDFRLASLALKAATRDGSALRVR